MRKISIVIVIVLACCATIAYTQIKVASSGNVGMGLNSSTTPLSRLSVNTAGATNVAATIEGTGIVALDINNKVNNSNGSELPARMYIYSLIANGKEVDTKRMILTK